MARYMTGPPSRSSGDMAMNLGFGGGRIKRKTLLSPELSKKLKKQSAKQGKKLQKEKGTPPRLDKSEEVGIRVWGKPKALKRPINEDLHFVARNQARIKELKKELQKEREEVAHGRASAKGGVLKRPLHIREQELEEKIARINKKQVEVKND